MIEGAGAAIVVCGVIYMIIKGIEWLDTQIKNWRNK